MNINIRQHILNNFKDANKSEIKASIEASIEKKDGINLTRLGIFFKVLWKNSDENSKEYIINTLKNSLK